MLKNLRKKVEGFTIIEVLIVLAIAGLIMLIVFLAVPALQRNQRNTSRKNDVGRVGAAGTEWLASHNGVLPATTDQAQFRDLVGTLSQYLAADIKILAAPQSKLGAGELAKIVLVTDGKCDTATAGAVVAGTTRQMAVQYMNEGNPDPIPLCQEVN